MKTNRILVVDDEPSVTRSLKLNLEADGGNVAAQLRADPLWQATPVLFLTALVSNEETNGPEKLSGGETFLAKPVDLDELKQTLAEHLRH